MTLVRGAFLQVATGAAVISIAPQFARADTFPDRPVHVVIGFAPGGVGDLTARLIEDSFQQKLGQPLVLDHRPGAGGNVGTAFVAKSAADG
jgi:tripartite-type tricarboxylate transporter receptor subunit TctC